MLTFFIVLILLVVVLAALKALGPEPEVPIKGNVYYLRKSLLSPAERSFCGVLETVLPPGVRIFSKVRLGDIFGVVASLGRSQWQQSMNRINRKHVDFLLVRANDMVPLAGIELDDSSHRAEDRQERDAFVDSVFKGVGLPLLHVPAQKSYTPAEIKSKIADLLS